MPGHEGDIARERVALLSLGRQDVLELSKGARPQELEYLRSTTQVAGLSKWPLGSVEGGRSSKVKGREWQQFQVP